MAKLNINVPLKDGLSKSLVGIIMGTLSFFHRDPKPALMGAGQGGFQNINLHRLAQDNFPPGPDELPSMTLSLTLLPAKAATFRPNSSIIR
jgi:hypothetical protein